MSLQLRHPLIITEEAVPLLRLWLVVYWLHHCIDGCLVGHRPSCILVHLKYTYDPFQWGAITQSCRLTLFVRHWFSNLVCQRSLWLHWASTLSPFFHNVAFTKYREKTIESCWIVWHLRAIARAFTHLCGKLYHSVRGSLSAQSLLKSLHYAVFIIRRLLWKGARISAA